MTAAMMPTLVWGLSLDFPEVSVDVTDSMVGGECDSAVVIVSVIGGECESEVVTEFVVGGRCGTGS